MKIFREHLPDKELEHYYLFDTREQLFIEKYLVPLLDKYYSGWGLYKVHKDTHSQNNALGIRFKVGFYGHTERVRVKDSYDNLLQLYSKLEASEVKGRLARDDY